MQAMKDASRSRGARAEEGFGAGRWEVDSRGQTQERERCWLPWCAMETAYSDGTEESVVEVKAVVGGAARRWLS